MRPVDGRELAMSAVRQHEAAEDVRDLKRQLTTIQTALTEAEQRLAQATEERCRLLQGAFGAA